MFWRLSEARETGRQRQRKMATLDETLAKMSVKHDRLHDIIDIAPQTYGT